MPWYRNTKGIWYFSYFFQNNSNAGDNTNDGDDSIENDEDMEDDEQDEVKEKTNLPAGLVRWREGIEKVQIFYKLFLKCGILNFKQIW